MDTGYWLAGVIAVLGFQLVGEVTHLYASWRLYSLRQELSELALACIAVGGLLVVAAFLAKTSAQYSRFVMVLWWMLAFACLALVTGSARMDTFRQSGESLAGRYF